MKKIKKLERTANRWFEEYRSPITGKTELISTDKLENLAKELVQYCMEDPTATLTKFAVQLKGVPWDTFIQWVDKFPILNEAYKNAKIIIGDNREAGALKNELNDKIVLRSLPMYLERWKEAEEWQYKLKKDTVGFGAGVFKIEMPSYDDGNKG